MGAESLYHLCLPSVLRRYFYGRTISDVREMLKANPRSINLGNYLNPKNTLREKSILTLRLAIEEHDSRLAILNAQNISYEDVSRDPRKYDKLFTV